MPIGVAAGISVFAFAGGVTDATQLRRGDGVVFDDTRKLAALLKANEAFIGR